jgi:cell pole-organizing protein PopZ
MTQPSFSAWCETLQRKLMAAIDAAWATLEASDDPAAIRKARDKAKACGDLAAVVRKIATMTGQGRAKPPAEASPAFAGPAVDPVPSAAPVSAQVEHAVRALEKLKGGRRGRL